jgi:hypothetical protein
MANSPQAATTSAATAINNAGATPNTGRLKFPYPAAQPRLARYQMNDELFAGRHFDAFKIKVQNEHYNRDYAMLKYVTANFAGLISKLAADMLFGEPSKIKVPDGDQDFIDALVDANKLDVQNYESALGNSRHGDAVYKLRVGLLNPGDTDSTVIIEDITPTIYFPHLDPSNVRAEPECKELAWVVKIGGQDYVRQELHYPGRIENKLFKLKDGEMSQEADLSLLGIEGLLPSEETGIKESLIIHVPNWKDGGTHFGYDDYSDLTPLFYAINNRMTKTENILDKHSDPILALPEGVLDEKGQVKKEAFHMFEIPSSDIGSTAKPEYIVWNASLDANFKHIDYLMDMLYMFSETTPDAFGMAKVAGAGAVSGRALKLKLVRTIAKINRKRLYYDAALKQVIYVAQLLAQAHKLSVDGVKLTKKPVYPEIDWQDGLPVDSTEAVTEEQLRIESGTTSKKQAIMRLDGVDEDTAQDTLDEIKAEDAIDPGNGAPKPLPANDPNAPTVDPKKQPPVETPITEG